LRARGWQRDRRRDRKEARLRRLRRPPRTQDAHDRAGDAPSAPIARPRLPLPRLQQPSLRRRPPHPALAQGGGTTLDDLLLLCRRHHRCVHEGDYRVDEEGRFYDRWGELVPAAPCLPRGHPGEILAADAHHVIDAGTVEPGTGEKMDLDLAVDAFVQIIAR
jgi:hypothetical protein